MQLSEPVVHYLSTIGKRGGKSKSARKAEQSRINGAKHTGKKNLKIDLDKPSGLGVFSQQ